MPPKFTPTVAPALFRDFAAGLAPLPAERVPLAQALGRVLAGEIRAASDLPPFRRSMVDGYAVRAAETTGASASAPAYLTCAGEVLMGRPALIDGAPGECCRIPTGGMLPASADAVVMVEFTRELAGGLVEIGGAVHRAENVVEAGEDLQRGALVTAAGKVIRPQEVGILAGLGHTEVEVRRRVRVAILSTGDELVEPGVEPAPGQVRNVNQYSLQAHVLACGGVPRLLGIAPDERADIERRVREGLTDADIVLISGGSSVGTRDHTAAIIEALGPPGVIFHGVAVRPGKPTILGRSGERIIFGLPGHPISAMVSFLNFVRPVMLALVGARDLVEHSLPAILGDNVHSRPGREDYIQVTLRDRADGRLEALPIFRKSGMVMAMVGADGYIVIPAESEGLESGDAVAVHPYCPVLR